MDVMLTSLVYAPYREAFAHKRLSNAGAVFVVSFNPWLSEFPSSGHERAAAEKAFGSRRSEVFQTSFPSRDVQAETIPNENVLKRSRRRIPGPVPGRRV